jgi:hypothetical protein
VDDVETQHPTVSSNSQLTLATHRDSIDTRLAFFRDLLSDKPVQGADTIRSLADWSDDTAVDSQSGRKAVVKRTWDGEAEKVVF